MSKKVLLISIIAVIVLVALVISFSGGGNKQTTSSSSSQPSSVGGSSSDSTIGISSSDLQKHNSQSDCWVAFQGKVYDITSFLPKHPGSAGAISPYCGTSNEFEQAFLNKHGTMKIQMLMKVGVLMGDFQIKGVIN